MESATDQRKKFWSAVSSGVYFENNGFIRVHKRYIDNVEIEYKNNVKCNKTVRKRAHKIESYSRYRIFFRNHVYQYLKVISPHNRYKIYWDCVNIIIICFSCLFIPFFVGFRLKISPEIYSIFIVLDFINFIDLCLNFRTAYFNKSINNYEYDPSKITLQYLKFWFWWDLLASIPTDLIINAILYNDSFHLEQSPKALILLRLFYFLKLSRIHKFFELKNIFEEFQLNPILIDVQILAVRMAFISHLLACFWNFIATFDNDKSNSYYIPSATNIVHMAHNTWVYSNHFDHTSIYNRYVASLYWSLTTMLTVGYGDIRAVNWGEQLFSIVAELLGVVIFGAIVARIVEILKNVNPQRQAVKAEISELMAYLGENQNIPGNIKADAKLALVYYLRHKTCFGESDILQNIQLPSTMLKQFLSVAFATEIQQLSLLQCNDIHFIAAMVMAFKPFKTENKRILFQENDVIDELVFVMTGSVQMITTTTTTTTTAPATETAASSAKHPVSFPVILGQVSPGGYFGDMEYKMKSLCFVSYSTVGKSSLHSLSYVDLYRAIDASPQQQSYFYSECIRRYHVLQEALSSKVLLLPTSDVGAEEEEPHQPHHQQPSHHCYCHEELWLDGELCPFKAFSKHRELFREDTLKYSTLRIDAVKGLPVSAEESVVDINRRWIIDPQNSRKFMWDIFICVLVTYSVFCLSITLSFSIETPSGISVVDWLLDGFFCLDLLIICRTAYFNREEVLVTVPSKIMIRYLRGWFWIDFLSAIPLEDLLRLFISSGSTFTSLRLLKTLRLFRFFKLNRVMQLINWVDDNWSDGQGLFEISKLMISVVVVSHIVACLWWVLADVSCEYTWFDVNALRGKSLTEQYIASLYWTVTTLTTVGYGDIIPSNSAERIIACFVMLLGGVAFGYIVGNMSSLLSNFDPTVAKVNKQLDRVRYYLEEKEMSSRFVNGVLKHLKNRLRHSSVFDEEAILSKLPTGITREILGYRHAETISSLRIFKYIPNRSVVLYLRNKIQPLFYHPDQLLFLEGEYCEGVISIVRGKIELFRYERTQQQQEQERRGSMLQDKQTTSNKNKNKTSKDTSKLPEVILGYRSDGDIIGAEDLCVGDVCTYCARAMTLTNAFILTQSRIGTILAEAPSIGLMLQQSMVRVLLDIEKTNRSTQEKLLKQKFINELKMLQKDMIKHVGDQKKSLHSMLSLISRSPKNIKQTIARAASRDFRLPSTSNTTTQCLTPPTPPFNPTSSSKTTDANGISKSLFQQIIIKSHSEVKNIKILEEIKQELPQPLHSPLNQVYDFQNNESLDADPFGSSSSDSGEAKSESISAVRSASFTSQRPRSIIPAASSSKLTFVDSQKLPQKLPQSQSVEEAKRSFKVAPEPRRPAALTITQKIFSKSNVSVAPLPSIASPPAAARRQNNTPDVFELLRKNFVSKEEKGFHKSCKNGIQRIVALKRNSSAPILYRFKEASLDDNDRKESLSSALGNKIIRAESDQYLVEYNS